MLICTLARVELLTAADTNSANYSGPPLTISLLLKGVVLSLFNKIKKLRLKEGKPLS